MEIEQCPSVKTRVRGICGPWQVWSPKCWLSIRGESSSLLFLFFVINNSSYMFQFKQKDRILTLGEMDAIVAEFWGVEVDPKWYACPPEWPTNNWFDCIGHGIEDLQYIYTTREDGSKHYIHGINGTNEFKMEKVIAMVMFNSMAYASFKGMSHVASIYKPFIELCEHLDKLGITSIGLGW